MSAFSEGPIKTSLQIDEEGTRTYTVIYQVKTTHRLDGSKIASEAAGLPRYLSSYRYGNEFDAQALRVRPLVANIRDEDETYKIWDVTATFSTKLRDCGKENIDNPLELPPKFSGSFVKNRVVVTKDRFGKPIVNAAGEPFVPAPEDDESLATLQIEINLPQLNLPLIAKFYNKVNSDRIWGLEPRMVLFDNFTWSRDFYGKCLPYYPHRFEFLIDKKKFNLELLNEGFMARERRGADPKPVRIGPAGDRPDNPVLLDRDGVVLARDGQPVHLTYEIKGEERFGTLNLPKEF